MSVAVIQEVARKLGGQTVHGAVVQSQADLALAVRNRLPLAALAGLAQAGLSQTEIDRLTIPQRTRRHGVGRRQPLTVEESDRAVRLLRVQTLAEEMLADNEKANRWLRDALTELEAKPRSSSHRLGLRPRDRDHPRQDRPWRRGHAKAFDGGYGPLFDGRGKTVAHAVTHGSTSPSLCVLEKLVQIEDSSLLPEMMVTYEIPLHLGIDTIGLEELPGDWRRREAWTQQKGDDWHGLRANPLLRVPSAIVPLPVSPDVNFLINHKSSGNYRDQNGPSRSSFVFDPCFCEPRIDVMEWPSSFGGFR